MPLSKTSPLSLIPFFALISIVFAPGVQVRGWTPLAPASVMGQWQAIRLGIDRTPYGIPFWNTRPVEPWKLPDGDEADTAPEEEEPEPFWTGLQGTMAEIGEVVAPPGSPLNQKLKQSLGAADEEN